MYIKWNVSASHPVRSTFRSSSNVMFLRFASPQNELDSPENWALAEILPLNGPITISTASLGRVCFSTYILVFCNFPTF